MDDLTTLLHDAVEDVAPTERLAAITRRTQTARSRRTRRLVVGGAVLATAAVVTAVAVVGSPGSAPGPQPAAPTTAADPDGSAFAIYYIGDTPQGPRLFREFRRTFTVALGSLEDGAVGSIDTASIVETAALDPDYTTPWPAGSLTAGLTSGDVLDVSLSTAALERRPAGMSAAEARLALQQVVYTVQGEAQRQLSVRFVLDGAPVTQVYGVPTPSPVTKAPELDVLALVSISDPTEGRAVSGSFTADGRASSFEGTVLWELRDPAGAVVRSGIAQGTMEDHLTPWETDPIDVTGLPPGRYVFAVSTDDPTGGEGGGPTTDTRTVVIR